MQESLFEAPEPPPAPAAPRRSSARAAAANPQAANPQATDTAEAAGRRPKVIPHPASEDLRALAARLPAALRLGTSSWSYPGWAGQVWDKAYAESVLSRHGLEAYAQHPLFRSVSLDRAFYRPLTASQYAGLAAQVPADFRFTVKAPSLVADALVRAEDGRGMQPNPAFLDPALAVQEFVEPALQGLGGKAGALVFQISPLPAQLLHDLPALLRRFAALLHALPALRPAAPDGVVALEVRDAALLAPAFVPEFAAMLRDTGATYCLGLHAKLPPIEQQLPLLRRLWPGPLVCRWNLNRRHGAYGYEDAEKRYQPFDRTVDPDPETRAALARVAAGTAGAGQNVFITVSNNAEGCAPQTLQALAQEIAERLGPGPTPAALPSPPA